jgi:hypothetical protein
MRVGVRGLMGMGESRGLIVILVVIMVMRIMASGMQPMVSGILRKRVWSLAWRVSPGWAVVGVVVGIVVCFPIVVIVTVARVVLTSTMLIQTAGVWEEAGAGLRAAHSSRVRSRSTVGKCMVEKCMIEKCIVVDIQNHIQTGEWTEIIIQTVISVKVIMEDQGRVNLMNWGVLNLITAEMECR